MSYSNPYGEGGRQQRRRPTRPDQLVAQNPAKMGTGVHRTTDYGVLTNDVGQGNANPIPVLPPPSQSPDVQQGTNVQQQGTDDQGNTVQPPPSQGTDGTDAADVQQGTDDQGNTVQPPPSQGTDGTDNTVQQKGNTVQPPRRPENPDPDFWGDDDTNVQQGTDDADADFWRSIMQQQNNTVPQDTDNTVPQDTDNTVPQDTDNTVPQQQSPDVPKGNTVQQRDPWYLWLILRPVVAAVSGLLGYLLFGDLVCIALSAIIGWFACSLFQSFCATEPEPIHDEPIRATEPIHNEPIRATEPKLARAIGRFRRFISERIANIKRRGIKPSMKEYPAGSCFVIGIGLVIVGIIWQMILSFIPFLGPLITLAIFGLASISFSLLFLFLIWKGGRWIKNLVKKLVKKFFTEDDDRGYSETSGTRANPSVQNDRGGYSDNRRPSLTEVLNRLHPTLRNRIQSSVDQMNPNTQDILAQLLDEADKRMQFILITMLCSRNPNCWETILTNLDKINWRGFLVDFSRASDAGKKDRLQWLINRERFTY